MEENFDSDGFRRDQFRDLRMELGHLKTCQNASIAVGITGSGIILALLKDGSFDNISCLLVFLPLLILFPFWLLFFDKARTISRIVGFLQIQELLMSRRSDLGLIGWQSAIERYHDMQDDWNMAENRYIEERIRKWQKGEKTLEAFRVRMQFKVKKFVKSTYWVTVFAIFFLLSLILLSLGLYLSHFPLELLVFLLVCSLINIIWNYYSFDSDYSYVDFSYFIILQGMIVFGAMILGLLCYGYVKIGLLTFQIGGFYFIAGLALVSFVYISSITYWIFSNLLFGRYTYRSFVRRWEVVLGLIICGEGENQVINKHDWQKAKDIAHPLYKILDVPIGLAYKISNIKMGIKNLRSTKKGE